MKLKLSKTLILLMISVFFIVNISAQDEIFIQKINPPDKPDFKFKLDVKIQQYIKYYQGRGKEAMEVGVARFGLHEKMIKRIFREEGIPEDLSLIKQVEDTHGGCVGFNSSRRLWLFAPSIAGKYGLRKTKFIDESLSFEKATRATAQYLKFLSRKYKDNWELAIAAYYSGEQIVDRAIHRAKRNDFWKISKFLPREMHSFVPNVLAIVLITKNLQKYAFENIQSEPPIIYDLVRVPSSTSLDLITQFSEADPKDIKNLNPELLLTITPPEPYVIRIPSGKGEIFAERMTHFTRVFRLIK